MEYRREAFSSASAPGQLSALVVLPLQYGVPEPGRDLGLGPSVIEAVFPAMEAGLRPSANGVNCRVELTGLNWRIGGNRGQRA